MAINLGTASGKITVDISDVRTASEELKRLTNSMRLSLQSVVSELSNVDANKALSAARAIANAYKEIGKAARTEIAAEERDRDRLSRENVARIRAEAQASTNASRERIAASRAEAEIAKANSQERVAEIRRITEAERQAARERQDLARQTARATRREATVAPAGEGAGGQQTDPAVAMQQALAQARAARQVIASQIREAQTAVTTGRVGSIVDVSVLRKEVSGARESLAAFDRQIAEIIARLREMQRANAGVDFDALTQELDRVTSAAQRAEPRLQAIINRAQTFRDFAPRETFFARLRRDLDQLNERGIGFNLQQLAFQLSPLSLGAGAGLAGGIQRAFSMEETLINLQAVTGSATEAQKVFETLEASARRFGQPVLETVQGFSRLIPILRNAGAELDQAVSIAVRLATINPAQGIEGAILAISEALSGSGNDFVSLAERFNISRASIRQAVQETGSIIDGLDLVLTRYGRTEESAELFGRTGRASLRVFGEAISQFVATGLTPMLNGLTPVVQGLTSFFTWLNQTNPLIAQMTTLFLGVTAAAAPVLLVVGNLTTAIQALNAVVAASGFFGAGVGLGGIARAGAGVAAALPGIGAISTALAGAVGGISTLGGALLALAPPILLITSAIAGLGFIITEMNNRFAEEERQRIALIQRGIQPTIDAIVRERTELERRVEDESRGVIDWARRNPFGDPLAQADVVRADLVQEEMNLFANIKQQLVTAFDPVIEAARSDVWLRNAIIDSIGQERFQQLNTGQITTGELTAREFRNLFSGIQNTAFTQANFQSLERSGAIPGGTESIVSELITSLNAATEAVWNFDTAINGGQIPITAARIAGLGDIAQGVLGRIGSRMGAFTAAGAAQARLGVRTQELTESYQQDQSRVNEQRALQDRREQEDFLRRRTQEIGDFARQLAESDREYQEDRAERIRDFENSQTEMTSRYHETRRELTERFHLEETRSQQQHERRLQQIREQASRAIRDAALQLDASGIRDAMTREQDQLRDAERSNEEQTEQRREEYERQLVEQEEQYVQQREQRAADFARQLAESDREHGIRRQRQVDEFNERLAREDRERAIRRQREIEDRNRADQERAQRYQDMLQKERNRTQEIVDEMQKRINVTNALRDAAERGLAPIQAILGLIGSMAPRAPAPVAPVPYIPPVYRRVPTFAEGGIPPLNTPVLVGERGMEMVEFTSPARIYSNDQTRQMMGGSVTIENFAPVFGDIGNYSPQEVMGMVDRSLRQFFTEYTQRVNLR